MTIADLKQILASLPDTAKIHIGEVGNDDAVRFVSLSGDTLLICKDRQGSLPNETVMYDATPEGE